MLHEAEVRRSDVGTHDRRPAPPPLPIGEFERTPPPLPAHLAGRREESADAHVVQPVARRDAAPSAQLPSRTAGDQVLRLMGVITLQSWVTHKVAQQLLVPELTALVQSRPTDPRPLVWLGIRVSEMERLRSVQNRSRMPVTWPGLVLRPLLRPAGRAVARSLGSGDGRPGSHHILEQAWQLLASRVETGTASSSDLVLLARLHAAAGDPLVEPLARAALELDSERSDALYLLAEIAFDQGHVEEARRLAGASLEGGCTLAHALLRDDAQFRRSAHLGQVQVLGVIPNTDNFWQAKERYFEGASRTQLFHYLGPTPL